MRFILSKRGSDIDNQKQTLALHCQEPWFSFLRYGIKTIEGRKNSPKYSKLKNGDILRFFNGDEWFYAKVVKISKYRSMKEFIKQNDLNNILPGIKNFEDAMKVYTQWTSFEELNKYEFLGIHIELLKD